MKRLATCNHTEGPQHDCAYVDFRDSLIPLAEAEADAAVAGDGAKKWDAYFHRAMNRLAAELVSARGNGVLQ